MDTIVVNATALDTAGALTILRQFIEAIPQDENIKYIIFISPFIQLQNKYSNIQLVPIYGVKSLICRFLWDAFGIRKWLRKNNIIPTISLSLQNTNFRTGYKIPNYVYYHQSIPFFKRHWSFFNTQERPMWFYKNIYPFFVRIFLNRRTEIFVQLEFIRNGFTHKFGKDIHKIHVISPKITTLISELPTEKYSLDLRCINLFYPATPFFYKNHKMLIDAINRLKNKSIALYLTCNKTDIDYEVPDNVHFMGSISFNLVMSMYRMCDAMVFPSYIETYGLPLIEAASNGSPIIAADLPYAREVLTNYSGAVFIPYDKPDLWSKAIENVKKGTKYPPMKQNNLKSWNELFKIITKK